MHLDKKISMVDIAKMTGVSIATVSRVLNRNGRYSEETEKKVMDAVKQYNYQINQSAKSLRTSKTQSIGVIVPDITNEFFARIVRSIETYIVPEGYTVFVCDSNENAEMEDFHIQSLIAKDVDGIIFISSQHNVQTVFYDLSIPVVYIDRRPKNVGTLITSDNEMGGFLATRELIESGCKRILMLRDEQLHSTVLYRYAGYANALDKFGIKADDKLVVDIPVSYSAAKETVTQFIIDEIGFDGVFANNDMMALGALHACRDMKVKVPSEVKIVGFDGISITEICDPSMTTVLQNTDMFGEKSVEALLRLIRNHHKKDEIFIIPVELKKRDTTRA